VWDGEKKMMTCPKCGYEQEQAETCIRCGIIIEKYWEMRDRSPYASSSPYHRSGRTKSRKKIPSGKSPLFSVLLILSLIVGGIYYYWKTHLALYYGGGIVAPNQPQQTYISSAKPISSKNCRIIPLAKFSIEARVLSKKQYDSGRESELSPVDLVLGWGPMSDNSVIRRIVITQSNRWYHWSVFEFPIPQRQIETNSANMHMIPTNSSIAQCLDEVRKGDLIAIQGYLVQVNCHDSWHWKSSLTREDVGDGACELIWVEQLTISKKPFPPS
jgi:hypothetical protein